MNCDQSFEQHYLDFCSTMPFPYSLIYEISSRSSCTQGKNFSSMGVQFTKIKLKTLTYNFCAAVGIHGVKLKRSPSVIVINFQPVRTVAIIEWSSLYIRKSQITGQAVLLEQLCPAEVPRGAKVTLVVQMKSLSEMSKKKLQGNKRIWKYLQAAEDRNPLKANLSKFCCLN